MHQNNSLKFFNAVTEAERIKEITSNYNNNKTGKDEAFWVTGSSASDLSYIHENTFMLLDFENYPLVIFQHVIKM